MKKRGPRVVFYSGDFGKGYPTKNVAFGGGLLIGLGWILCDVFKNIIGQWIRNNNINKG